VLSIAAETKLDELRADIKAWLNFLSSL